MGKIYFVGAGSGDPELLTLKGRRLLETADVIIYDRLVNPVFLLLAKEKARFIYSGKYPKQHLMKQKTINQLLIDEGRKQQTVVRLKGGDPGVFGRVGEEIAVIREQQIQYELVPGVTAASAASSYSGIPLTHRDYSNKVTLATAHRQAGETVDFSALINGGTLCLYMGVEQAVHTAQGLIEQGSSPQLPVAIIEWGSLGRQRTITTTLAEMSTVILGQRIKNPSLLIIGEVVKCREGFDWFEKLPLFGRRMLLIDIERISLDSIILYTQQGADVYAVQVGEARDKRFDEVHRNYLSDHLFDQIIYLNSSFTEADRNYWHLERIQKNYLN